MGLGRKSRKYISLGEKEFVRKGESDMIEKIQKSIKKTLEFEKNGETFSVEVNLVNVSPQIEKQTIKDFLNQLYEDAINSI